MPEQQPTVYKKWPKAIWEQFCQEFAVFFSMAVSNTVLVDGVEIDSLDHVSHFGVCSTAAATQVKTVNCPQFNLVTGARIVVGFTVTNTASSVQLNVNNTGAVNVVYKGSSLPINSLTANSIREFVYDGTNYQLIGDLDTTATGVEAAIVELWEGRYDTTNESSVSLTNAITLSDSIENYDYLRVYMCMYDTSGDRILKLNSQLIKVEDITYDFKTSFMNSIYSSSNEFGALECRFSDATHFGISWKHTNSSDSPSITRIEGIKYIQPDSYSTSETLVGTWIDGSPIYRRVFENISDNFNTGLTNVNVIDIRGMYHDIPNHTYLRIPCAANFKADIYVNESGLLTVQTSSQMNNNIQWVAIDYTKITT